MWANPTLEDAPVCPRSVVGSPAERHDAIACRPDVEAPRSWQHGAFFSPADLSVLMLRIDLARRSDRERRTCHTAHRTSGGYACMGARGFPIGASRQRRREAESLVACRRAPPGGAFLRMRDNGFRCCYAGGGSRADVV